MSAALESEVIRPGERAELKSLVRMRIKLLRSQIADRHATQMAEIDGRVAAKFREDAERAAALRAELDRAVARANRQVESILAKYPDLAESRCNVFARPWIQRPDQGRDKLRKAMVAGVTAQTESAKLRVAQLESELLSELALTAIKTEAAKEFVRAIPDIDALMPANQLTEIETRYDTARHDMTFIRRRRYREGIFYLCTNWFRPRSWGIHEGPLTYNVTRKRLSVRLPFGLGSWQTGGRR